MRGETGVIAKTTGRFAVAVGAGLDVHGVVLVDIEAAVGARVAHVRGIGVHRWYIPSLPAGHLHTDQDSRS